jgi:hypothetical protein
VFSSETFLRELNQSGKYGSVWNADCYMSFTYEEEGVVIHAGGNDCCAAFGGTYSVSECKLLWSLSVHPIDD